MRGLRWRARWLAVTTTVLAVLGSMLSAPDSVAAAAPPPVSQLRVIERTDHSLTVQFAVPAAYYHPGAGVVVRITRGGAPAANVNGGYAVTENTSHQAKAGANPPLAADAAYTFAIWVRDAGQYSRRVTITTTTLKDTSPPDLVVDLDAQASAAGSGPHVVLSWENPCCDELDQIRIVRNTSPTTTGGTVFTIPGTSEAFNDRFLPASIVGNPGVSGISPEPLYYFVIAKDRAGNYARFYSRTSVVVGSRTISGRVTGEDRSVTIFCCPGDTGEVRGLVFSRGGFGEDVDGGRFSVTVPPGVFTVCSVDSGGGPDPDPPRCWVDDAAGGHAVEWDGSRETIQPPTIDLRLVLRYEDVQL